MLSIDKCKLIVIYRKVINLHISYILDTWSRDLNTVFTLGNSLFEYLKLTKKLILININIVVMVLDSMHVHSFY